MTKCGNRVQRRMTGIEAIGFEFELEIVHLIKELPVERIASLLKVALVLQ